MDKYLKTFCISLFIFFHSTMLLCNQESKKQVLLGKHDIKIFVENFTEQEVQKFLVLSDAKNKREKLFTLEYVIPPIVVVCGLCSILGFYVLHYCCLPRENDDLDDDIELSDISLP